MITFNWPESVSDDVLKHIINFLISEESFLNCRFNLCDLNWILSSINIVRRCIPNVVVRTITDVLYNCVECISDIIFTVNFLITDDTVGNSRYESMYIITTSNNCICCSRYKGVSVLICLRRNTDVNSNCTSLFDQCTSSCRYKCVCRCITRDANVNSKCITINNGYFNPLTSDRISLSRICVVCSIAIISTSKCQ